MRPEIALAKAHGRLDRTASISIGNAGGDAGKTEDHMITCRYLFTTESPFADELNEQRTDIAAFRTEMADLAGTIDDMARAIAKRRGDPWSSLNDERRDAYKFDALAALRAYQKRGTQ
jgi:hypothetical protein